MTIIMYTLGVISSLPNSTLATKPTQTQIHQHSMALSPLTPHPTPPFSPPPKHLPVTDASDGKLLVTPYFGVPPYTYTWSHAPNAGINDSVATGLSAGTYTVTVTDSRDSVAQATIELTQPALLAINRSITPVSCFNETTGAIDISPTGGTAPYQYNWSTSDGAGVNATAEDQSNIPSGTYSLSLTDSKGCTLDSSFVVSQPEAINFNGTTVSPIIIPPGNNGAINLMVNGGVAPYSFLWSNGETTEDISNLTGGVYTVQLTDQNGCPADSAISVNEQSLLLANISAHQNVSCNGLSDGSATVSVTGSTGTVTYRWLNAAESLLGTAVTINGLAVGTYHVAVADDVAKDTAWVIIQEPAVLASSVVATDVLCNGEATGLADLTVSGGTYPYTYAWSNGKNTEDIANLLPGSYSVNVTDANGCTTNSSAQINEPAAISVSITVDQPVLCPGNMNGIATAAASGGTGTLSYQWDDLGNQNTATADLLSAGTYTVTVTDDNSCQATRSGHT